MRPLIAICAMAAGLIVGHWMQSRHNNKEIAWAFVCGYRSGQIDIMGNGFAPGTFSVDIMKNPDCPDARALAVSLGFTHGE